MCVLSHLFVPPLDLCSLVCFIPPSSFFLIDQKQNILSFGPNGETFRIPEARLQRCQTDQRLIASLDSKSPSSVDKMLIRGRGPPFERAERGCVLLFERVCVAGIRFSGSR